MPKFSHEELEEIRQNTERVEKQRKTKKGDEPGAHAKKKSSSRTSKSGKKNEVGSLQERLIGPTLLFLTLVVTYCVMWWSSQ